jgi:hypothetical protein
MNGKASTAALRPILQSGSSSGNVHRATRLAVRNNNGREGLLICPLGF